MAGGSYNMRNKEVLTMKKRAFTVFSAVLCLVFSAISATACGLVDWIVDTTKDSTEKHVHEMAFVEAKEATCEHIGNRAYWYCKSCNKKYYDEQATREYSQHELYISQKSHNLVHHERVPSDCAVRGTEEYWSCLSCKKNFANAQGTSLAGTIELPLEAHTVERVDGTPCSCTQDGVKVHYNCSVCHKNFADKDATQVLTDGELILPASHKFAATYSHDERYHWREVLCEHKDVLEEEAHDFGESGNTCATCGYRQPSAGLTYAVDESAGTACLTGAGSCTDKNIAIAETYEGKRVTGIAARVFMDKTDLLTVFLPDSITEIGDSAFNGCVALKRVNLPKSLISIGKSAFYDCFALTSLIVPDSVQSIGSSAFYGCEALSSLYFGEGVTEIGGSAFAFCYALESVTVPASVLSIGSSAFYSCKKLVSLTLADGLKSIGNEAFLGCAITTLVLPDSVTAIGNQAFADCGELASLTIGSGVETIGNQAFSACRKLESVTLGKKSKMKSIGDKAFYACTKMAGFVFPFGLENIGSQAFWGCSMLKEADIPITVNVIKSQAFNLQNMNIYPAAIRKPDGWASDWAKSVYHWNILWGEYRG